MKKFKLI